MKKLVIFFLSTFLSFALSAQVKKYVGIVREKHYPALDEFLEELGTSLKKRGYSSYAEYVDAYRKGGFGSGFVYVDKDGTNYIITNRHVVSQAASASVEFENDDGSITKYENLSVLITDDDIDIAILRFDGDKNPFKKGLSFYSGKLTDGQDVVSAGFPGLAGEPVWQFGKGSVTNASARIKDLIDPSVSTIIQHSAQIDAGNSGGPLLIASKNDAVGYEVAGINTWKAVGRDATNFSIPSNLALKLLEKSNNPPSDEVLRTERNEKFIQAIMDSSNDYTSIVKFISYNLASQEGAACFDDILRHAPSAVINRVASEFAYNPIEGLRYAVAYNIYNSFPKNDKSAVELDKIVWKKEHGIYRIDSVDDLLKDKKGKKNTKNSKAKKSSESSKTLETNDSKINFNGIQSPYFLAINGGIMFVSSTDYSAADLTKAFDLALNIFPFETGVFGIAIEYEHLNCLGESLNAFGGELLLRLPLDFDLFCVSPKAGAGFKMGFGEPKERQFFWELGVETMFDLGLDFIKPGFEVSYRKFTDTFDYFQSFVKNDVIVKGSGIVVKVTLGFEL